MRKLEHYVGGDFDLVGALKCKPAARYIEPNNTVELFGMWQLSVYDVCHIYARFERVPCLLSPFLHEWHPSGSTVGLFPAGGKHTTLWKTVPYRGVL